MSFVYYAHTTTKERDMTSVADVIIKYRAIPGDYENTVWDGVEHYMLDSGICTDAFSVQDAERVYSLLDEEFVYDNGIDDINEAVKAKDNGLDLDCVLCLQELEQLGFDWQTV
jgi:hypothetical protein